ncbi:MAG: hypothetical protein JW783_05335 [Bacteroidales bacterium]|nr:hypothetical protein [Bacteroidales bacterium]MBN2749399.1 hypothetical protein [Bacteroidales bacterium]
MRRIVILLIALLPLVLFSCKEKEKKMIEDLTRENEMLKAESLVKDSSINEYFKIINEIEHNLSLVKTTETMISKDALADNELKDDTRERINQDIKMINDLMAKNKRAINLLNKKLKSSNLQITELNETIERTMRSIEERDAEISILKDHLTNLNFSVEILNATVDTLRAEKAALEETISSQTSTINTAWFAFGTKKELVENGVIEKAGGFLGFGKSYRLKSDFDKSYFTTVNITKTFEVPLFAKKAALITSHPSSSYKLVQNAEGVFEKLEILDVTEFWHTSKYLVITVE